MALLLTCCTHCILGGAEVRGFVIFSAETAIRRSALLLLGLVWLFLLIMLFVWLFLLTFKVNSINLSLGRVGCYHRPEPTCSLLDATNLDRAVRFWIGMLLTARRLETLQGSKRGGGGGGGSKLYIFQWPEKGGSKWRSRCSRCSNLHRVSHSYIETKYDSVGHNAILLTQNIISISIISIINIISINSVEIEIEFV